MTPTAVAEIERLDNAILSGVRDEMEVLSNDVDLAKLVLDLAGKHTTDIEVTDSIIDGDVQRTVEGASTLNLTLHDADRKILQSNMLVDDDGKLRTIDVNLDGLWFRLVQLRKAQDDLNLTFEDRQVARLRAKKGARSAGRNKVTRAEFVRLLVRAVKSEQIRFFCPELHKRQPITGATQKERQSTRDNRREAGFPDNANLKGKEGKLTKGQLQNAARALAVAESHNAPELAILAMLCTCIVEAPDFKNPTPGQNTPGSGTSVGMYQATDIHGSVAHRRDIEAMTTQFLLHGFTGQGGAIPLARAHKDWSPGRIAQACQGSAFPSRYDQYARQAKRILNSWHNGGGSIRRFKKYVFKVDKKESYWDAIQRLAQEVAWRAFMVSGTLYFISEVDLFNSRARATISEDTPGVQNIDFDWDKGKPVNTVTVECRINRWDAPPGTIVELEDCGPCDGKWLVSNISRPLFSAAATITLKKPMNEKLEPRPEAASGTASGAKDSGGLGIAEEVYAAAKRIHRRHFPYVWGGGHGQAGTPSGGGYDCSGGVAACLEAAGIAPSAWQHGVPTSGVMANSWGKPGKGKYLTMYANGIHVFLILTLPGKKPIHLGTGDWGKGWKGFGVNKTLHPTAGFTARHWPGT